MIESTVTRSPPTLRTMSAKTVVVATTLRAPDRAALERAPDPQAVSSIVATAVSTIREPVRPSLDRWREGVRRYWVMGQSGGDADGAGHAGQAGWTEPEQLETVFVDAITGPLGDLPDDESKAGIVDLVCSAAA